MADGISRILLILLLSIACFVSQSSAQTNDLEQLRIQRDQLTELITSIETGEPPSIFGPSIRTLLDEIKDTVQTIGRLVGDDRNQRSVLNQLDRINSSVTVISANSDELKALVEIRRKLDTLEQIQGQLGLLTDIRDELTVLATIASNVADIVAQLESAQKISKVRALVPSIHVRHFNVAGGYEGLKPPVLVAHGLNDRPNASFFASANRELASYGQAYVTNVLDPEATDVKHLGFHSRELGFFTLEEAGTYRWVARRVLGWDPATGSPRTDGELNGTITIDGILVEFRGRN